MPKSTSIELYGVGHVRHAVTSGALRQKAIELGVELPPEYVDNPVNNRVNGRDLVNTAA
jgi:hypothetical protein